MNDNLKFILDGLKKTKLRTYQKVTLDLSLDRSNEEFLISGSYIYVLSLDGTASVRFNEITSDLIDLQKYRTIETPFYRLYFTNTAQPGKKLVLAIGIETDVFNIQDFGVTITQELIEEANTPTIFNVTCTLANTEYSQSIGECRKFTVKPRNGDIRLAFAAGGSGTTYLSILENQSYWEDFIHPTSLTLYFRSPTAGTILEIVRWL